MAENSRGVRRILLDSVLDDDKPSTKKLGDFGELTTKYVLMKEYPDSVIKLSEDQYDSEKDIIFDDFKVEVKTQTPMFTKHGFTIRPSQENKVRKCNELYIFSVPAKDSFKDEGWFVNCGGDPYPGVLFRCKTPSLLAMKKIFIKKENRDMLLIPWDQDILEIVYVEKNKKLLKKATDLSYSSYDKKKSKVLA